MSRVTGHKRQAVKHRRSRNHNISAKWRPTPSRYMPHQGKRECARRRAQSSQITLRRIGRSITEAAMLEYILGNYGRGGAP